MGCWEDGRGCEKLGNIVFGKRARLYVGVGLPDGGVGVGWATWAVGAAARDSSVGTGRGATLLGCCAVPVGTRDGRGRGVDRIAGKRRKKPKIETT